MSKIIKFAWVLCGIAYCNEKETLLFPPNEAIISTTQLGGIGYTEGYTTLSLFLTSMLKNEKYLFLDGRFHAFNNGKIAGNLGVGGRNVWTEKNSAIGCNWFVDFRNDVAIFQRTSIGLDLYTNRFFLASNAYFLISDQMQLGKCDSYNYVGGYSLWQKWEEDSFRYGWDGELGCFAILLPKFRGYLGAGPYYLRDDNELALMENVWGVKARAFAEVNNLCHLEFIFSEDPLYGKKYQGKISISISWPKNLRSNGYIQVARQEIIPTNSISSWAWNW